MSSTQDGGTPPSRRKLVVLVDSLLQPGGGERLAVEGALRVSAHRYDRAICISRWDPRMETTEPARGLLRRLRDGGVEVIPVRRRSRLAIWAWQPLLRRLRDGPVDVLHGHVFGSNVWAAVLGRAARVPAVVAHEHMWSYQGSSARALIDRNLIARWADAFIAVSESGRRAMVELERIPAEKVVLIRNGAPALIHADPSKARKELGIPSGAPVAVSVGHLRKEKAFDLLIEAIALLTPQHPQLQLMIAGEGPERESLERMIEKLGLAGRVRLLGQRADVSSILAAADVAVCCSDFEGGPLSVLEYMQAGLPVVATRVGGLPELIEDGSTGFLVPPRDPPALANRMAILLDDPELRRRLGSRGRDTQVRDYEIDAWARRIEKLYDRLLADSGARTPGL